MLGEQSRATHRGSAPAPSAACSLSVTPLLLFPGEALQICTLLPLDSPAQTQQHPTVSAAEGEPRAISDQGTGILQSVNEQIEILICFRRILWQWQRTLHRRRDCSLSCCKQKGFLLSLLNMLYF